MHFKSTEHTSDGGESASLPTIINPFPDDPLKASQEYVRQGMVVVPQYWPDANHTGKEPTRKGYKELTRRDMTEKFVHKHFGDPRKPRNLGLILQDDHIVIDLDSKEDQGRSAREWLQANPHLHHLPCEETANGLHLHLRCQDVPTKFLTMSNAPSVALDSPGTVKLTAELFTKGKKVTVAPSRHSSGAYYRWTSKGDLPMVYWEQIEKYFRFIQPNPEAAPEPNCADRAPSFNGDLSTLDIVALFKETGLYREEISSTKRNHSVKCPFSEEHSDAGKAKPNDTSTAIFERRDGKRPGFKCLHAHCAERGLLDALERIELDYPGLVDRNCAAMRKPRILLPGPGHTQSDFARNIAEAIARSEQFFIFNDALVEIIEPPIHRNESLHLPEISGVTASASVTAFENLAEFGRLKGGTFKRESPQKGVMEVALASRQMKNNIPRINTVSAISLPTFTSGQLSYPTCGFNGASGLYLSRHAVKPVSMSLDEAVGVFEALLGNRDGQGFCWRSPQDQVNATARLITPYCRFLMDFAKVPVFVITANQPRLGKDQLANSVIRVYTGRDCAGAPLNSRDDAEMRKRITSLLKSGAPFIHFSNMKGHVNFPSLEAATDGATTFSDRELGSNRSLELRNTAEYSLSMNIGATLSPDLQGRAVMIELFYEGENPNLRRFRITDVNRYVDAKRPMILGACDALVKNWVEQGSPPGPTPFASFPDWGRVVGGILVAARIGDPCLRKTANDFTDPETADMMRLYEAAHQRFPGQLIDKKLIYTVVNEAELFPYLDLTAQSGKTKFGKVLGRYDGRELASIRMTIDKSDPNRTKYLFRKATNLGNSSGVQTLQALQTSDMTPHTQPSPEAHRNQRPTARGDEGNLESDVCNVCDDYRLISRAEHLNAVIERIQGVNFQSIAIDLETYGPGRNGALDPRAGRIRLIQLGLPDTLPILVDCRALTQLDLKPLLDELTCRKLVGHNLKFDLAFLHEAFGFRSTKLFCTCTAARILTAGDKEAKNDLASVLERHLGLRLRKDQGDSEWSGELSREQLHYAANDVRHLLRLAEKLQLELTADGLDNVSELEMDLIPVVVRMETVGVPVAKAELDCQMSEVAAVVSNTIEEVRQIGGEGINVNSRAQLLEAFFKLGFELEDTTESTLAAIDHPLAATVLKYRTAKKQLDCLTSIFQVTGPDLRLHATFNPLGAATGRFSCKSPNLQNVPRGPARRIFAAPEGMWLVKADYSQIELRVVAVIAQESAMLCAYVEGRDLHLQTAALILGKEPHEVTDEQRRLAKAVNFGLLYGQKAAGLRKYARTTYGLELPEEDADIYRRRFLSSYPALDRWQQMARNQAGNVAEARSLLGRRRLLPTGAEKWWDRYSCLLNHPVQASAADGLKRAMIRLDRELPNCAHIVSTVHDELLVEVTGDRDKATDVQLKVKQIMEVEMATILKSVPVEVEVVVCRTWEGA